MAKNIAVYGIYPDRVMVEKAVEELKDAGFRHSDISVLFPAGGDTKEFAIEKETKAPEGAATGGGTGAVVGGIAGTLVGLGIPEYEANLYEGRIKDGGILLSIHADDREWKNKGKEMLERTGAEHIGSKGESGADDEKATVHRPEGPSAHLIRERL